MNMGTMHLLQQEIRRFESMCTSAVGRLQRAKTLAEVSRLVEAHPPALIRHLPEARRALHRLKQAGAARAQELVSELVTSYAAAEPDKQEDMAGALHTALRQLQGRFPQQYAALDQARLKFRKKRPIAAGEDPAN